MATIRKKGDCQWHVQIRRKGYPHQTRTFTTRADAEKWARQVETELDKGIFVDRSEAEKNTLHDVLKRYRDEISPTKRGADIEKLRINTILKHYDLVATKMAALSSKVLAGWRDERLKSVSGSTVNRELNILSAVINQARKEWGIHVDNPVALIRRPQSEKGRERRLELGEERLLLEALELSERDQNGRLTSGTRNIYVKPLVLLALETAMRRGELLSLRWENVDLKKRVACLPETKNGETRNVPLSSCAVEILENLPRSIDGRVFPTTEDALKKAFSRARERAKINDLHFHDLRHEATSRLAEKLANVIELAAVTGHKDLRMLKRYYHPRAEDLAKKLG